MEHKADPFTFNAEGMRAYDYAMKHESNDVRQRSGNTLREMSYTKQVCTPVHAAWP